jgi:hypothetical protein
MNAYRIHRDCLSRAYKMYTYVPDIVAECLMHESICKNEVYPNCHYNMFEKELYQSDNKYLKTI